ncbi:Von Willebrand factor type A domain containing protein [Pandoravirus salinus]|uniref:von Willebrand factor type A domain containing protein n=1 Tax=Pandoravirus salinus TaxID=1349410 RepID=S4VTB1_9VIRU|nr:Von Willebrand factor type A domain [Pandoravirus salinus]AGO83528.1 Von Willebrand factor type A domain containing protein [Pandoravirus salinus]
MLRQQQTHPSDRVTYTSLGGDLGLLTVESAAQEAAPRRDLHVVFVLDRSDSMAGTFRGLVLPACAGYLDAVAPRSASAVYFNDRAKVEPCVTAATLRACTRDGTYTTRIDRGVAAAVDFVLGLARPSQDAAQPPVYQFVFMTDGANDSDCTGSALERAIAAAGSKLRAAACDAFVSVINVGAEADTRAGMWTHAALSTMSVSTEGAFAVARAGADVPQVVATLAAHTLAVVGSGVGCLRTIDLDETSADPGGSTAPMIIALAGTVGQRSARIAGTSAHMLVSGGMPKTIRITRGAESERVPVIVVDALDAETAISAIETVDDHVRRVAMVQVSGGAGLDVPAAVSLLRGALDAIDASGALAKDAAARMGTARTPAQRVRLMRRTVAASRERVASIRDTHLVSRAAAADMAAYVDNMGATKYGAAALKRAATANMAPYDAASIMRALAQARPVADARGGDDDDRVKNGHQDGDDNAPCSFFSQATASELWTDATCPAQHEAVRAAAGGRIDEHVVLAGFGMLGYGLRTRRSAAAYVEPWHLGVLYVSCDPVATNDAIGALAADYRLEDASRKRITDVVVVREPARPAIYDAYARTPLATAYLAVVHARNPSVGLPSQRVALPALAMMRAAAQVAGYHGRDQATGAHARVLLRLVLHAAHVMTENERAAHVALTLAAPGEAGCGSVLTTKSHVHRVAQAVAYMVCRPESAALVDEPLRIRAAAQALLAQAVVEAHASTSTLPSGSLTAALSSLPPPVAICASAASNRPVGDDTAYDSDDDGDGDGGKSDDDDPINCDDHDVLVGHVNGAGDKHGDNASDTQTDDDALVKTLDAILATDSHPVPLADDVDEPTTVDCATDYDARVASEAGRKCLQWMSRKAPVVDALVGVALVRALHEAIVPMARDARAKGLPLRPVGGTDTLHDVVTAFVASSAQAEEACANALSAALKDPLATDVAAFIAHYWSLSSPGSTDADDHNDATALCAAALAAQALQRPTASKRCADPDTGAAQLEPLDDLDGCRAYLSETASTVRRQRYRRLLTAKNARLREAERMRREAAAEAERERSRVAWRAAHVGMPVVFTADQVEAHNRAHPDDPWSLSVHPTTRNRSALLADRCCFASCPDYMRRLGNAGLWEHLAPGQCTPAFHVASRQAFAGVRRHYGTGKPRADILVDFTAAVRAALSDRSIVEYGPDMYSATLAQFERAHGLAV